MSVSAPDVERPSIRSSAALWVARAMLALLGLAVVGGSIYFSFFASDADGGASSAVDYVLGAWALVNGIGFLVVAILLGQARPEVVRITRLLILAHLLFSAIKIVGYGETEGVGIAAVDLAILALLHVGTRVRS